MKYIWEIRQKYILVTWLMVFGKFMRFIHCSRQGKTAKDLFPKWVIGFIMVL